MDFSRRKIPIDEASNLRAHPVESAVPYVLLFAPVYVQLVMNRKFVSVKAPLDFFSPEELARFKTFGSFHVPPFEDRTVPFREAGSKIRTLLSSLPPAPYELSDAVLRVIGPLWGAGTVIEPFFVVALVQELCGPWPAEKMREARERDVKRFERAIFQSSWAVFLGLHLGNCELQFLDRLRLAVFDEVVEGRGRDVARTTSEEIAEVAGTTLPEPETSRAEGGKFQERAERAARRIGHRLQRVQEQFVRGDVPAASIFGTGGLIDA